MTDFGPLQGIKIGEDGLDLAEDLDKHFNKDGRSTVLVTAATFEAISKRVEHLSQMVLNAGGGWG